MRHRIASRPKSSSCVPYARHVRAARHRHLLCRDDVRGRHLVLHVPRLLGARARRVHALLGTTVERPVADDAVGHAGGDRQRCAPDDRQRHAATEVLVDEVVHALDAQALGEHVRRHRVAGAEGGQPVDVAELEPGVGHRRLHRPGRQPERAHPRVLRELGGADAGDRGLRAGESRVVAHLSAAPSFAVRCSSGGDHTAGFERLPTARGRPGGGVDLTDRDGSRSRRTARAGWRGRIRKRIRRYVG